MVLELGDVAGWAADRETLLLEGRDWDAEERAGAKGSAYWPASGRAQGHQAPEVRAGCSAMGGLPSRSEIEGRSETTARGRGIRTLGTVARTT